MTARCDGAVRLIPVIGAFALMGCLLWSGRSTVAVGLGIAVIWGGLIAAAALVARRRRV